MRSSVDHVMAHPELVKEGSAATYGLIAQIPSGAIADQFLVAYLDKVLKPTPSDASATTAAAVAAAAAAASDAAPSTAATTAATSAKAQ